MSDKKKHILLVEDNPMAAKAAQFIFEKILGCQVEHVDDGDKAISSVKENHYDAICMDIGLPSVSGTKACIAIRQYETQNHLSPIPIIALTGNCSPEEENEYKAAGMQEVLAKPLTKEKAEHFLSFCKK